MEDDISVSVVGFPATYNDLKLKLFVLNHVGKTDVLESVEREGEIVVFKFKRSEDLQTFLEKKMKDISFGNETYKLSVKEETEFQKDTSFLEERSSKYKGQNHKAQQIKPIVESIPEVEQDSSISKDESTRYEGGNREARKVKPDVEIIPELMQVAIGGNGSQYEGGNQDAQKMKLYVKNIPSHLHTYDAFRYHFERFGRLEKCFLRDDRKFAFVTYTNHGDACNARLNGSQAGPTRRLNIQWAIEKNPNPRPTSYHQQMPYTPEQRTSNQRRNRHRKSAGQSATGNLRQNVSEADINERMERPKPGARRRSEPEAKKQIVLDERLFKKVHYWNTLSNLPAPPGSTCVLAQNIDPDVHIQKVRMHFESKKRSGGGEVASIVRMVDGVLIVFADNMTDCQSCLNHKNQLFDDKELIIFEKTIPNYYKRRFVLEGVGDNTTSNTLEMYLEHCSKTEASPTSCLKQSLRGVYLIEYDDEFDINEMDSILQKIQQDPLEEKKLKASRLLETDCLKVTDILEEVTTDTIRFMFQSEKRTSGGPVTKVERCGNKTVLVYFASFELAERVYKRFKKPCTETVILGGHPVEVELYFHSLSSIHKCAGNKNLKSEKIEGEQPKNEAAANNVAIPKRPLRTFSLKPKFHENIFFFIRGNKKHMQKLKSVFAEFSNVELAHSKKEMTVNFTPEKSVGLDTQNGFNTECKNRFEDFSSTYSTDTKTFDEVRLQHARSLKNHTELNEKRKKTSENGNLSIKWQPNKPIVDVTGLKDEVEKMIKHIETIINTTEVDMEVSEKQYRILLHCGIIDKLQKDHQNIEVKCDDEKHNIILSGPDSDVTQFRMTALQLLINDIYKKKLTGIDVNVTRFILESSRLSSIITTTIQAELTKKNVKATLELDDDEIFVVARSEQVFNEAIEVIKALIAVHSIPTDKAFSDVVSSPSWKSFQQKLKKEGQCELYIKPNQCIMLVAFVANLPLLVKNVSDFLDENAGRIKILPARYGIAKYIVERSREFSADSCEKRKVKCGLTANKGGGISIEGKRDDSEKARADMVRLIGNIEERKHTLHDPGIKDYYESDEGRDFLKSIEQINNCVILTSTPTCKEWESQQFSYRPQVTPRQQQPSAGQTAQKLYSSIHLPKTGVSLQVWKTNIIDHSCDVIVNASNPELKLLNGGVSGEIKKFDKNGNTIQKAMNKLVRENHGDFLAGDAGITTAGNLPACKKIVHAIGPKWNSTSERVDPKLVLKACISKSLFETESAGMTSISIPAVSCGIFGGKFNICIPLIVEAVVEYFEENKTSRISRVEFVELSDKHVLDEFKRSIEKYRSPSQVPILPVHTPRASSQQNVFLNTSSVSVNLLKDDIANQKTDVIVNVTSSKGLQGSAISTKLLSRGGVGIQQGFSQLQTPLTTGSVHETTAGNLSCNKLYHAIVTKYATNSEGIIRSIVRQCLTMADRARYRSIAFPALATGGFGHPAPSVAKWMKEEICRFSSTNLQNAYIVLYPTDAATISAFEAEFSGQRSRSMKTLTSSTSTKQGILNISVYQGDITQEQSDAIVNSTNGNFDLSQAGAVSQAILASAGRTIQTEILNRNATGADIAVTSGGNLPCNMIFHIATPSDDKNLTKKILQVLENAERSGITSISIPALATGGLGLNSSSVAAAMKKAFDDFEKTQIVNLKTINVVVFDPSMLNDFKTIISSQNTSVFNRIKGALSGIFQKFTTSQANAAFDLFLYSTNPRDIDKAIEKIKSETGKTFLSQSMQDDAFGKLTDLEKWDIMEICKKNRVTMTDKSNKYYEQYVLHGLIRDVFKAHEAVKDVLRVFTAAETSAMFILWQEFRRGVWVDYPPQANHILEKAYQTRNGNNRDPALNQISVPEYDDRHRKKVKRMVDLSNLEGDQSGSNPPTIRRKVKERGADDVIPNTWEDMKGQRFIQVRLSSKSQEFQTVQTKFINAGGPQNIIEIHRIQNPSLYKQYVAKKSEVENKLTGGNPVERELFHGTADADKILLNGFDRSYAGKNATAYGRGVYFAVAASYSNGYATPDVNGRRRMFLANVVTGDYCLGSSAYVAPPPRSGTVKNDLYDSVVNNVSSPQIFVIFKDASAYPSYLITYS